MTVSAMYALAELVVAGSLAILVVGLARRPLRRLAGAQVSYLLWLLVPVSALVVSLPAPSQSLEAAGIAFPRLVLGALPSRLSPGNFAHTGTDYSTVGVAVWVSGCALMLAFMVNRQRVFMRSLRNMTAAADGTYRSASVAGPVLVGIWAPRIVLPIEFETRYSPEERALVLAHEEAHKRRFDVLVNAFATVWLCLFWFNPLMYWALSRLRFDQELACDAAVLARSGTGRRRYAEALLKTQLAADSAWRMPVGCQWQPGHPLQERVAMLKRPSPAGARRLFGIALVSVLISSGSYVVWAAQPGTGNAHSPLPADPEMTITADRVSTLEDGDIRLSGNVVVRCKSADHAPQVRVDPGTIDIRPDGSTVLAGAVRFVFTDRVLTTERAIVEKDGTIRMDSARATRRMDPR